MHAIARYQCRIFRERPHNYGGQIQCQPLAYLWAGRRSALRSFVPTQCSLQWPPAVLRWDQAKAPPFNFALRGAEKTRRE